VPGHTKITSAFGWRIHPVYRYKKFHSGSTSLPARGQVVAARSGTVILVSAPPGPQLRCSGYGNYIVIDHGDGKATLYGHLKQTEVKVAKKSMPVTASD
jgi:murein DD-endopeptidase MepM/ murein hydrolase activator NlpD